MISLSNRTYMVLPILVIFAQGGCARPQSPAAFERGEVSIVREDVPPQERLDLSKTVQIAILAPDPKQEFKPGESIDCLVQITLLQERKQPLFMVLQLRQKGTNVDTCNLDPDKIVDGNKYQYKGRVTLPKQPGRYALRAQAGDTTLIKSQSAAKPDTYQDDRLYSAESSVTVVRK